MTRNPSTPPEGASASASPSANPSNKTGAIAGGVVSTSNHAPLITLMLIYAWSMPCCLRDGAGAKCIAVFKSMTDEAGRRCGRSGYSWRRRMVSVAEKEASGAEGCTVSQFLLVVLCQEGSNGPLPIWVARWSCHGR